VEEERKTSSLGADWVAPSVWEMEERKGKKGRGEREKDLAR